MKRVYHRKYRYSMLPTLSSSEVSEVTAPKLWRVAEHVGSPGSAELLSSSAQLCELDLNQTMGMLIELSCSCNYVESHRDQIEERQGHFHPLLIKFKEKSIVCTLLVSIGSCIDKKIVVS